MPMRRWRQQAQRNLLEWGEQSYPVLALAIVEELGELAQALLEHEYEDGDAERMPDELADLGALAYRVYWRRTGYPGDVEVLLADA